MKEEIATGDRVKFTAYSEMGPYMTTGTVLGGNDAVKKMFSEECALVDPELLLIKEIDRFGNTKHHVCYYEDVIDVLEAQ